MFVCLCYANRRKAQEREEVERTLTRKMSEVQERHVSWADTVKAVRVRVTVSALGCNANAHFCWLRVHSASFARADLHVQSGTHRHTDRFRVYVCA